MTIVLTLGTIVFSEILPKSLGSHYAPLIGRLTAPAIRAGNLRALPGCRGLAWFSNLFKTGKRHIGTEAQIRSLVSIGHRAGYIESDEGRLIHRSFRLNDRTAGDIMTPLAEVVAINSQSSIHQATDLVLQHAYSRYPVFGASTDDFQGLVMSRDVFCGNGEGPRRATRLDNPPRRSGRRGRHPLRRPSCSFP